MGSKTNVLNRIFTRDTLRDLISGENMDVYYAVIKRYIDEPKNKNNREIISEIYKEIKKNYRNEYYYKNTILNKLLLGIHSINTTTALTEIPIAGSKADYIMINGKAVVYEIKSELDNLDRLSAQINDYYKAFDHVAVVTCADNVNAIKAIISEIKKPVGIYIIKNNGAISEIEKPQKYTELLEISIMYKLLRKREVENILLDKYGYLPDVSQFKYYRACKEQFEHMKKNEAYEYMLQKLKDRSNIQREKFINVPYELKFLVYFMNLNDNEYKDLDLFLNKQYGGI